MAAKKKAATKAKAKAAPKAKKIAGPAKKAGEFARGDRVRVTTEGPHENARGLVRSQDGDAVTVELFRPKGRRFPKEFSASELQAAPAE